MSARFKRHRDFTCDQRKRSCALLSRRCVFTHAPEYVSRTDVLSRTQRHRPFDAVPVVRRVCCHWSLSLSLSLNCYTIEISFPQPRESSYLFSDRLPTAAGDSRRRARARGRRFIRVSGEIRVLRAKCDHGRISPPKDKRRETRLVRYYKPLPFYPSNIRSDSLSLSFISPPTRCASIRHSPRLAILFGLPFDADYQTLAVVVQQSGTSISTLARILGDFAIPPSLRRARGESTGRLSFGRAAEKARQSLWDFIRDYQR